MIAKLFTEVEVELFDTNFDDIKQVHDFFSPFPESDRGLRVTVKWQSSEYQFDTPL
jgi:hypothetical protein